eukprot:COSAG02_NODE_6069_length_3826_cov_23.093373_1_plen_174_part_00
MAYIVGAPGDVRTRDTRRHAVRERAARARGAFHSRMEPPALARAPRAPRRRDAADSRPYAVAATDGELSRARKEFSPARLYTHASLCVAHLLAGWPWQDSRGFVVQPLDDSSTVPLRSESRAPQLVAAGCAGWIGVGLLRQVLGSENRQRGGRRHRGVHIARESTWGTRQHQI